MRRSRRGSSQSTAQNDETELELPLRHRTSATQSRRRSTKPAAPRIKEEVDEEEHLERELTVVSDATKEDTQEEDLHQAQSEDKGLSVSGATLKSDPAVRRLILRSKILSILGRVGPILRPLLIIAAVTLLVLLPSPVPPFSRHTYVDENALQPGAANVQWDWGEVGLCDAISRDLEDVKEATSSKRAQFVAGKLHEFGLTPATQSYSFRLRDGRNISGVNTYARWNSGRSDGREAVIIAASWQSQWRGQGDPDDQQDSTAASLGPRRVNVRGVSATLGLAKFLTAQMHWSKDLIFVFSDGYMDGMQAWSNAYFGRSQDNLQAEPVECTGAVIWNGIAIDYPYDSFSDLVLLHQGKDGQLPNMDVLNTLVKVAENVGRVPVRLPGTDEAYVSGRDDTEGGGWGLLGRFAEERLGWGRRGVARYRKGASNLLHQLQTQAVSHPTGLHGLFQRFHVDAVTIFATPAKGPHGFYDLGRMLESQVKSYSNLIERLHHSQFFYLLSSPGKFVQLGIYLPIALLLSVALTLTGLSIWLSEGAMASKQQRDFVKSCWKQSTSASDTYEPRDAALASPNTLDLQVRLAHFELVLSESRQGKHSNDVNRTRLLRSLALMDLQKRPIKRTLTLMLCCHVLSLLATILSQALLHRRAGASEGLLLGTFLLTGLNQLYSSSSEQASAALLNRQQQRLSLAGLLHAFTMLHAGMGIAVLSVLNFSAAAVMGILLTVPLFLTSTSPGMLQLHQEAYRRSRLGALVCFVLFAGLLPWNLCRAVKTLITAANSRSSFHPYAQPIADAIIGTFGQDPKVVDQAVDAAFFDYEVLATNFIPIASLLYTPILLESMTASLIRLFA